MTTIARQARSGPGGPAPLFDRLTDADFESAPLGGLDRAALLLSVAREIADLLNTRAPWRAADDAPTGAPSYGAPDFSRFSMDDPQSRAAVEATFAAAIEAFEPRLANPSVRAQTVGHETRQRFEAEWSGRGEHLPINASLREISAWTGPLPEPGEPGALLLDITGDLRLAGGGFERVSFPVLSAGGRS